MRLLRGAVRYHAPRDRSPLPALVVGVLVLVTLVSAQLWVAGGAAGPTTASGPPPAGGEAQEGEAVGDEAVRAEAPPSTSSAGALSAADTAATATTSRGAPAAAGAGAPAPPVEVAFPPGSDRPAVDVHTALDPLVDVLLSDPSTRVRLVGHAEPSGDPVLEEQLSLARAEAVLAVLVARGLPPGRADLVAAGALEAGRSVSGTDRRVTVEVVDG